MRINSSIHQNINPSKYKHQMYSHVSASTSTTTLPLPAEAIDYALTKRQTQCATQNSKWWNPLNTSVKITTRKVPEPVKAFCALPLLPNNKSAQREFEWGQQKVVCNITCHKERKWHKSAALDDLASYQTLLASFSSSITAAKKTFFNDKINGATDARKLFSTFKTLLYPPPPPPATNLTADNFASFFTEKVAAIGKQFDQLSPPP